MPGLGVFGYLAAILQLGVPSYGLRLVRRYGAERVGWFLVVAFGSLAMVHMLWPLRPFGAGPGSGTALDIACVVASALLLIGMGHLETLCSERQKSEADRESRRRELETGLREQAAELARTNEELAGELAQGKAREKALAESEAQYRALFTEHPQPMWIFDLRSYRILAVNEAALRQYRFTRDEFMALTARGLVAAGSAAGFIEDAARPCSSPEIRGIWRHCRKDQSALEVELTAVDLKFGDCPARLVVARDTGGRRRRESDLRESVRLDVSNRIAGGVAHHFNNILTVIDARASLLMRERLGGKADEHLEQISAAANRAAALTRQLVSVSSSQTMQAEIVDLNWLLGKLSPMLRRLLGAGITLREAFEKRLPPAVADPRLLEPVVVNLVLNAREAMSQGGTLSLSTRVALPGEVAGRPVSDTKADEFICLLVRDNGCGMNSEVQAHLFEPFFTTREVGRGIGLGLASVFGIVKQHGGWVECSSAPGAGTEFRVFLPQAAEEESRAVKIDRRETILLVEPDERARGVARYFLGRGGYRVIEVDSAPTALELWEGQGPRVDLLVTAMHLPGEISGRELAERLRQSKPTLKIVYTLESEAAAQAAGLNPGEKCELVVKPFSPEGLIERVSQLCQG